MEALSQSLKPCLQGMEELPRDFTKMFDYNVFKFDVDLIPQAKVTLTVLRRYLSSKSSSVSPYTHRCSSPSLPLRLWET